MAKGEGFKNVNICGRHISMVPDEDHGDARDPERLCHGGPRGHLVEHRAALPQVGVDVVREGGRRPASSCLVCQQWYRSLVQSSVGMRR